LKGKRFVVVHREGDHGAEKPLCGGKLPAFWALFSPFMTTFQFWIGFESRPESVIGLPFVPRGTFPIPPHPCQIVPRGTWQNNADGTGSHLLAI
jgi:hypothetical protein